MTFNWINRRNALSLIALVALVILAVGLIIKYRSVLKPQATAPYCKYLVSYDRNGGASPSYLASNLGRIESMTDFPYNGVTILESNSGNIMNKTTITADTINAGLKDLRDMTTKPKKVKHNFVRVLLNDPGDMFDDTAWNRTANNFTALGQALKTLKDSGFGIEGVLFDNEGPYSRPTCSTGEDTHGFWNLPGDNLTEFNTHPDCWPYIRNWSTHQEADYTAKARERGKQVMQGLVAGWGDVKLIFMHSSDASCKNMDGIVRQNDVAYANEMLGPFAVGLGEGAYQTNAKVIDGGEESYGFTTDELFNTSYSMRDSGMVTTYKSDCSFIPTADQGIWSSLYDIGFALYNKVHPLGVGQTSSTIGAATQLALEHADNFVWFYSEDVSLIDPNKSNYINTYTGKDWMTSIINGRKAVVNDPTCENPSSPPPPPSSIPSPSIPGPSPTLCEPAAPSSLVGVAPSQSQVNLTWKDNATNENGFVLERKLATETTYLSIYNSYTANVTSYSDKNVTEGKTYNYRVRAYNGCGSGVSTYSNTATVSVPYGICEPAAPSGLIAKASTSSRINLTWQDNSSNENGFSIERSTSPSSGFVQIATVGANVHTYSNTGLQRNTTYYYRVRAFNGCGTGVSLYSNTSSAKTKRWWIF